MSGRGRPRLEVGQYGRISVRKLGPKLHQASCRYRDLDGKTRPVTATGPTVSAAEQNLKRRLDERVSPGQQTITADSRIATLAEAWIETVERSDRATNTKQRYAEVVRVYVVPAMGDLKLRECTPARCGQHVNAIADRIGRPTAKLVRSCLSGMFKLAFASEAVQRNPMRDVSATVERRKPKALTVEETRDILAALRADPRSVRSDLPDLVSFLAATGVRINEALAVRWADLDLAPADGEAATVLVRGTVVRVTGEGLRIQEHTKGKDDDEALSLALPRWIVPVLLARQIAALPNEHDVVFPSSVGTLRDATNFRDQWRDARERLGLESWVTPKSLRKAVATAVASVKGAEAAAEQLGHSSDEVTKRHYIERTRHADHRDVVEQFGPATDIAAS